MAEDKSDENTEEAENAEGEELVPVKPKRVMASRAYAHDRMGEGDGEQNSSAWLVTFTDAMALMLTFFVLMFAMAEPEKEFWTDVASALEEEFSVTFGPRFDGGEIDSLSLDRNDFKKALNLDYLKVVLEEIFSENKFLKQASITETGEAIVISFPEDLLFNKGSDSLKEDAKPLLIELSNMINQLKNSVVMHGHSDPIPLESAGNTYRTNWGLSVARALAVAKEIKALGYDREITVRGLGEGQFHTISEKIPYEERLALSRRVDILILDNDGTSVAPR